MSKQFKLLPEQVENLNNQIKMNSSRLSNLTLSTTQQIKDIQTEIHDTTNARSFDTSLLGSLHVTSEMLKEAQQQLSNYEILEPNTSDVIGLGSTFEIIIGSDDDVELLTLVQVRNVGDSEDYVSIDSPLGKAVIGARAGEEIKYMVEKRTIKGSITKIVKPKVKTL